MNSTTNTVMHRRFAIRTLAGLAGITAALPALAYVGPGAGLSLVGALWAVAVAVFAALFFVVAWPIRRMMKRRKLAVGPAPEQQAGDAGPARH